MQTRGWASSGENISKHAWCRRGQAKVTWKTVALGSIVQLSPGHGWEQLTYLWMTWMAWGWYQWLIRQSKGWKFKIKTQGYEEGLQPKGQNLRESVGAALPKGHSLGSLQTAEWFLTVLEAGSPKSGCQHAGVLVGAGLLTSCCILTGLKEPASSLASSTEAWTPPGGSTPMSSLPPKIWLLLAASPFRSLSLTYITWRRPIQALGPAVLLFP